MKRFFVSVALTWLLFAPSKAQQTTYIDTPNMASITSRHYTYNPKDDITVKELSKVVEVLLPAMVCRSWDCGTRTLRAIDALPPEVKRHFEEHQ